MALRSISLCTGYGGIELGLGLLGIEIEPICFVEIEAVAAAGLVAKMQAGLVAEAPVWSDVHTFPSELFRGSVDIVTGGYPCQPFSHAGLRLGEDDPRHLWSSIARILGELRPRLVFFENVEGHLTLGFDAVVQDLERLGYTVAAGIFSAAEVGANHGRKRLFILGSLADTDIEGPQGRHIGGNGGRERVDRTGGTKLADAEMRGFDGAGLASGARPEGAVGECGRPLFPPGPADLDAWASVLEARPDLAPATERAVRGMADGAAGRVGDRTDHLRLLGNGVVPMVAGYAFATLYASLVADQRARQSGHLEAVT